MANEDDFLSPLSTEGETVLKVMAAVVSMLSNIVCAVVDQPGFDRKRFKAQIQSFPGPKSDDQFVQKMYQEIREKILTNISSKP